MHVMRRKRYLMEAFPVLSYSSTGATAVVDGYTGSGEGLGKNILNQYGELIDHPDAPLCAMETMYVVHINLEDGWVLVPDEQVEQAWAEYERSLGDHWS